MKIQIRDITILTVFILVWVTAGFAQTAGQEPKPNNIGSFDISKVRELSSGPQTSPTGAQVAQPVRKETQNYTFVMLRLIGSLALIIALIFGVSWLIRKSGLVGSSRGVRGGGSMDVLEVLPLGPNRNMVMVRVMDTVYLCGQTATSISLLDKIEGQRAVELLTSSKGPSTVVQFKDAFNQFIAKMKK